MTKRKDELSDAEVWGVIAETIEGAGTAESLFGYGLCNILSELCYLDVINMFQKARMRKQIFQVFAKNPELQEFNNDYLWPERQIKVRVLACRLLSAYCLEGRFNHLGVYGRGRGHGY